LNTLGLLTADLEYGSPCLCFLGVVPLCPTDLADHSFMNAEARHELELLEALSENAHLTQRGLAAKLGMAVGLTNIYLKRLARKGHLKCVNVRSNRLLYLVTPAGIAEKTRLTYEFMQHSLRLYRDARSRLRAVLSEIVVRPGVAVAIVGSGEPAELVYVCLKELGIEPVAVFGENPDAMVSGAHVRNIDDHAAIEFDAMIVATFENPEPLIGALVHRGIPRERLVTLREYADQHARV